MNKYTAQRKTFFFFYATGHFSFLLYYMSNEKKTHPVDKPGFEIRE